MLHLACIMDGNRRWAKRHGFSKTIGNASIDAVERTISFCLKNNIAYLSLYAFSLENLERSSREVSLLFSTLVKQLKEKYDFFLQHDICIKFVGDKHHFPDDVLTQTEHVETATRACKKLTVLFYVCYGGQQEIISAAQACARAVEDKKIKASDVSHDLFVSYLWTPCDVPSPSVVIRTGGYKRLSNFLLFQVAYTELYFLACLWPDLALDDLQNVLNSFNSCQRNFGK